MDSQIREGKSKQLTSGTMISHIQQPSRPVSGVYSAPLLSTAPCDPIIPQNSDVTVRWNNKTPSTPESLRASSQITENKRRQVFSYLTTKKYVLENTNIVRDNAKNRDEYENTNGTQLNAFESGENRCKLDYGTDWESGKHTSYSPSENNMGNNRNVKLSDIAKGDIFSSAVPYQNGDSNWGTNSSNPTDFTCNSGSDQIENYREVKKINENSEGGLTNSAIKRLNKQFKAESACDLLSPNPSSYHNKKKHKQKSVHETIHAQCLLLGLAFMAAWFPQNCMAPNLTEMASDFGFDETQRDIYLGANIALAAGVLSFPIAAGIGILADIWNRKNLFCVTVALGGFSAFLTGASKSYHALFFARLLNGSFMSGSVPIAFSMLGDLFDTNERNAASSGLTSMMGLGIILGQVYAGVVGSKEGWRHPFNVSCLISLVFAALVLFLVEEPVRGGKEEVLQNMLKHGASYERKLTWSGFSAAMRNNKSNIILISQGFFNSIPWGIIFVFLNDYLSQERGFSVPDATYLVGIFGIGCAAGGILGGYLGQIFQSWNTSYLPLFMSATTFLGIFPFLFLLNGHILNAHSFIIITYCFLGGCLASMPSVCVRPCLINVNPPETRGATLTAANLVIQLARGAGPSCITLLGTIFNVDRQCSFNLTLSIFWIVSALQLLLLAKTLPKDQDAMETDLSAYATKAIASEQQSSRKRVLRRESQSFRETEPISIMSPVAAVEAKRSMIFVGTAFKEIGDEIITMQPFNCREEASSSSYRGSEDDIETYGTPDSSYFLEHGQKTSQYQQELPEPDEKTPLSSYYS